MLIEVGCAGEWVAVASNEGRGWTQEAKDLYLDLYIFKAEDGSQRRLILKNAGWPTWADDKTVYFHRIAHDGWWSIFRIDVSSGSNGKTDMISFVSTCKHHSILDFVSKCMPALA